MSQLRKLRRHATQPAVFDFESLTLPKRLRSAAFAAAGGLSAETIARRMRLSVPQAEAMVEIWRQDRSDVHFGAWHERAEMSFGDRFEAPIGRWAHSCGSYTRLNADGTIDIYKTRAMGPTGVRLMPEGFTPETEAAQLGTSAGQSVQGNACGTNGVQK